MTTRQTDAATLIGALRAQDIQYLISTADVPPAMLAPEALLHGLAQSNDPRLRAALVALFLRQPTFAQLVPTVAAPSPDSLVGQLQTHLLAALCLQRQWYWLLSLAFGHAPTLPEPQFAPLWHARGLPAPDRDFGTLGLIAMTANAVQRTPPPFDVIGDWQNSVAHLIAQEWPSAAAYPISAALLIAPPWHYPAMEGTVSLRPDVTRADIERFLQELGRTVRHPGRIYLAGGAALVHATLRVQGASTADIDLKLDVSDLTEVENAIRQLKVRLGVNVELASPADFIPLPTTWEAASQYVGHYGPLDVFYFDYTTLALAKIERGQSRDIADVALLAGAGLLRRDQLEAAFNQILPQLGTGRFFNIDPAVFARKLAATIHTVWSQQP